MEDDIRTAVDTLRRGGIILYPTDTIWGIGCDATNADAVERIYKLKQRADSKAMLVLVGDEAQLERTVATIPEAAEMLLEVAVNPLTIIYDHPTGVAPELRAEDGSVGIRITHERYSRELCRRLCRPIVSTSANLSGQPAPDSFDHISETIKQGVDYIAEYGRNLPPCHNPSAIIKVKDNGVVKVIR